MQNLFPKPLLVSFIGFPGSGKTYFSTRLAKKIHAITLNSDALRLNMFGSLEKIEQIRNSENRSRLYDDVFGAMNYAAAQALQAGHSVVYDAQMAKRIDRARMEALVKENGARFVLVWLQTDPSVAKQRGAKRKQAADSHRYTGEKIHMLVEGFATTTEVPDEQEFVVAINGELPFTQQYDIFHTALSANRV